MGAWLSHGIPTRDGTGVLHIAREILNHWTTRKVPTCRLAKRTGSHPAHPPWDLKARVVSVEGCSSSHGGELELTCVGVLPSKHDEQRAQQESRVYASVWRQWCAAGLTLGKEWNLENSAVATGMEKVSFHSNPKERQCQRMLKLLHSCTHLTR